MSIELILSRTVVILFGVVVLMQPLGPDEFYFLSEAYQAFQYERRPIESYPFPLFPKVLLHWISLFNGSLLSLFFLKLIFFVFFIFIFIVLSSKQSGLKLFLLSALFIFIFFRRGIELRPELFSGACILSAIALLSRVRFWSAWIFLYIFCSLLVFLMLAASPRFLILFFLAHIVLYYVFFQPNYMLALLFLIVIGLAFAVTYQVLVHDIAENLVQVISHGQVDLRANPTVDYKLSRVLGPRGLMIYILLTIGFMLYSKTRRYNLRPSALYSYLVFVVSYLVFVIIYDKVPYEYASLPLAYGALLFVIYPTASLIENTHVPK